jgi:hypothetical protein
MWYRRHAGEVGLADVAAVLAPAPRLNRQNLYRITRKPFYPRLPAKAGTQMVGLYGGR